MRRRGLVGKTVSLATEGWRFSDPAEDRNHLF